MNTEETNGLSTSRHSVLYQPSCLQQRNKFLDITPSTGLQKSQATQ